MVRLPAPLPDELLFSRIVRFTIQSGASIGEIQKHLFGDKRSSVHPTLTQGIASFKDENDESLESLYSQTLGAAFQMGLPSDRSLVISKMARITTGHISRLWQLPNLKGHQTHRLMSCPRCVVLDLQQFGVAYWHRSHQLPSVSACYEHGTRLYENILPNRYHLRIGLPLANDRVEKGSDIELAFAAHSEHFLRHKCVENKQQLLFFVWRELARKGFLTDGGQVRRQSICSSLFVVASALNVSQSYFVPNGPDDYAYLRNILSQAQYSHPGRLLIFLFWLSQTGASQERPSLSEVKKCDTEVLESECVELLRQNMSLNKVAHTLQRSRSFVKRVALKYELTDRLNPKRINNDMRNRIIKMAYQGWHCRAIAKQFEISHGSVEMVISAREALVEHRRKCRFESKRRRYRVETVRYFQRFPKAQRKDFFATHYAAAHWLYRNDHCWLSNVLPRALDPEFR